jgi:WD40 repeat protein
MAPQRKNKGRVITLQRWIIYYQLSSCSWKQSALRKLGVSITLIINTTVNTNRDVIKLGINLLLVTVLWQWYRLKSFPKGLKIQANEGDLEERYRLGALFAPGAIQVLFNSVAFSPDGKLIAFGSGDNTIELWIRSRRNRRMRRSRKVFANCYRTPNKSAYLGRDGMYSGKFFKNVDGRI